MESTPKLDQRINRKQAEKDIEDLLISVYDIFGNLLHILNQDGFVIFISGMKDYGKTNLALLLAEICWTLNFRRNIRTNIATESYMIGKEITNYDDLDLWMKHDHSRKLFVLDELGQHAKKMRFMSEKNQLIMDTVQLIRHYDAGIIGVAPSDKFVDSNFLNTDILDAHLKKDSRSHTLIKLAHEKEPYHVLHTPATSISYNSKDTALFTLHRPIALDTLKRCCAVAKVYAETGSYDAVSKQFNNLNPKQIRELLRRHIKHTLNLHFT